MHARGGFNIALTATSNPYLQSRLPLPGELEILETGTDGRIIHAVFRVLQDGKLSAPVEVRDIEFAYRSIRS